MSDAADSLAAIEAGLLAALTDGDLSRADMLAVERDALLRASLPHMDSEGLSRLARADRNLRDAVDACRRGLAAELEHVRTGRAAVSAYAIATASE